jgi:hypothetical protein
MGYNSAIFMYIGITTQLKQDWTAHKCEGSLTNISNGLKNYKTKNSLCIGAEIFSPWSESMGDVIPHSETEKGSTNAANSVKNALKIFWQRDTHLLWVQ